MEGILTLVIHSFGLNVVFVDIKRKKSRMMVGIMVKQILFTFCVFIFLILLFLSFIAYPGMDIPMVMMVCCAVIYESFFW